MKNRKDMILVLKTEELTIPDIARILDTSENYVIRLLKDNNLKYKKIRQDVDYSTINSMEFPNHASKTTRYLHARMVGLQRFPKNKVDYKEVVNYILSEHYPILYKLQPIAAKKASHKIIEALEKRRKSPPKNGRFGIVRCQKYIYKRFGVACKEYGIQPTRPLQIADIQKIHWEKKE